MPVYYSGSISGYSYFQTLFDSNLSLGSQFGQSSQTLKMRTCYFLFFFFLVCLYQISFIMVLDQKLAGLGTWPFRESYSVSLEYPAKRNCHDPFFFLCHIVVTNKKCFTVTSWLFNTAHQAELRDVIYFNFFNCAVFSLLTICQKISHGNSFIWWL